MAARYAELSGASLVAASKGDRSFCAKFLSKPCPNSQLTQVCDQPPSPNSVIVLRFCFVRRIDFRELVRDLFSLYKTRIWMQQLEPETTPSGGPLQSPYPPQDMHGLNMPEGMAGGQMDMGMNMGGPML